ncbi:Bromodomain-containing protein 1 [Sarcoptes scabiei]|nr:Bromodomain-containing protein 1 [Sarcoptes scabiei]
MTTRSERGVTVRKPSKDVPAPISTPPVKQPTLKKVPLNRSLKECVLFVKELFSKKHAEYAWPFWNPVSETEYPDYSQKIKKPIDLTTIKNNLETGKYITVSDFAKDMRLMFSNCLRYNHPESPIIEQVRKLREVFEYRYAQFPEDYFSEKLEILKPQQQQQQNISSMRLNCASLSSPESLAISSSSTNKKPKKLDKEKSHSDLNRKSSSSSNKMRISNINPGKFLLEHQNENGHSLDKEDRMKLLEMQVQRLTCALTSALKQNGQEEQINAFFMMGPKNDRKYSSASNSRSNSINVYNGSKKSKNGYNTKKSKRGRKRKHHLSSDDDSDNEDDETNSLNDLCESFDPNDIDHLKKLKKDLENLQATDLKNVLKILQSTEPSLRCDEEQNVEIDFEALQPKTLTALRKYVTSCMLNNKSLSPSSSKNNNYQIPSTSSLSSKNKKICNSSSLRGSTSSSNHNDMNNYDTDCDNNSLNWSRAGSRASNLQLSESSSSDSELD